MIDGRMINESNPHDAIFVVGTEKEGAKSAKMSELRVASWSYIIAIALGFFMLFTKSHLIKIIDKIVTWMECCSEEWIWFVVLISGVCLFLSINEAVKIYRKEQQVAHSTIAAVSFIVSFYSYFRFVDNTYEFWGLGWYKWCDILYLPFVLFIIRAIVCGKHKSGKNENACQYIPDRPINDPREDLFKYSWLSQSLLDDLSTIDVEDKSFSIGIVGAWGQGKSSFMNLFKYHIRGLDNSVVVEFFPRASKSVQSIQEDFFNAFKTELKRYHTGIERYISNYAREVAQVGDGWVGKLALAFNRFSSDDEMKRINSIIHSMGRRIYVLIEDLDRLTGEEILEVLKLMERNGNFCNTVFVTAYDKQYVNEVIGRYLQTKCSGFTDKFFDYEYSLPQNTHSVLSSYVGKYLSERIVVGHNDKNSIEELKEAWNKNESFIVSRLRTMRHVKRYLNIFMSRYPKVRNDVDASDFMLLTLLRYLDLTAYNAIFDLSFLLRGSRYFIDAPKYVYLRDDYEEKLTELQISDSSKEIIEKLFHKADAQEYVQLSAVYGRLQWADSFYNYFYDFRIGKYHFEDFQKLFSADEEDAFATVKEMQNAGISIQLVDFLKSRKESWMSRDKGVSRLIKIMVYLNSLERSADLDSMISRMLCAPSMHSYVNAGVVSNDELYRGVVKDAFLSMLERCPIEVGFACIRINDELIKGEISEDNLAVAPEDLVDWAQRAQRCYYRRYEGGDYYIEGILNLAKIYERRDSVVQVTESARRELAALMKLYPDRFAEDIIVASFDPNRDEIPVLRLLFNRSFDYERLLTLDDFLFMNWVESLSDERIAYIAKRIYETEGNKILQVPALKADYKSGDFEGYYEAVKAFDDVEDEKTILEVVDKRRSFDYGGLCEITGLNITRLKAAVERLITKKQIDSKFGNLKDRMDPFEKGDYVKFLDEKYESYSKQVSYSDNVFKIVELLPKGSLKLADIKETVPLGDVEAVPMDREHDRGICYDPITMATIALPGQAVPPSHHDTSEYYMDAFENSRFEEKTLKEIVDRDNCQFVHEVQHSLRKRFGRDDMKLNKSIKDR